MKNNIEQIIDIFNQYPNYFLIIGNNFNFIDDKIINNTVFISTNGNSGYFYLDFDVKILNCNSSEYDFFNTINNTKLTVNNNSKIKNIIEKVEDFIKEFEKRYKLYNYLKYKNAIEGI